MKTKRDRGLRIFKRGVNVGMVAFLIAIFVSIQCSNSHLNQRPVSLREGDVVRIHPGPEDLVTFGPNIFGEQPPPVVLAIDRDTSENLRTGVFEERNAEKQKQNLGVLIVSHTVYVVDKDTRAQVLKVEKVGCAVKLLKAADGASPEQRFWVPYRWVTAE